MKKISKIAVASIWSKLALFCFHLAFLTTFRSLKVTAFGLPISNSTLWDNFWTTLILFLRCQIFKRKMLIQASKFWKAQKRLLMQKKWSARLVGFLHFLFCPKPCFSRLQLAYKKSSILLLHHTFLKNWCLAISFNIVENASKSLHLRQKSGPPAWPDSYIFCFDQNLVFHGFN